MCSAHRTRVISEHVNAYLQIVVYIGFVPGENEGHMWNLLCERREGEPWNETRQCICLPQEYMGIQYQPAVLVCIPDLHCDI